MEDDGLGAQPHCSRCDIVMRELPGGLICPACGRVIEAPRVDMPADFDGPTIND